MHSLDPTLTRLINLQHQDGLNFSKSLPPALTVNYLASIEAVSPVMATLKSVDYFNDQLPNEIILEILSGLKKKDLKRARFTCKKLASLGGQMLVVNLYLSPREKDMAVFDTVTQHADLKKSVKNIIFDTAQFADYSFSEYLEKFNVIFSAISSRGFISDKGSITEAAAVLQEELALIFSSNETWGDQADRHLRLPVVMQGYHQYNFHA
ncbi:MAG: hypothetical protein Q9198_006051 [Flavoplaca austrocitrina]